MVRRFLALSALCLMSLFAFVPVAAGVARDFVSALFATVFAPEPRRFAVENPRSIFETRRLGLC